MAITILNWVFKLKLEGVIGSTSLVNKLGLPKLKHPRLYKLQLLNECGEMKITKQGKILFFISKYKDEVVCDVVPICARHLFLGHSWQYDRKVVHDRFTNCYLFVMNDKPILQRKRDK